MRDERLVTDTAWICAKCGRPLEPTKVRVKYVGSVFTMELPKCLSCGTVMVTEEVATGKMAEAEQALEDK